jgi:hypothetical protein
MWRCGSLTSAGGTLIGWTRTSTAWRLMMEDTLAREKRDQGLNLHLGHNDLFEDLVFGKVIRLARPVVCTRTRV